MGKITFSKTEEQSFDEMVLEIKKKPVEEQEEIQKVLNALFIAMDIAERVVERKNNEPVA